MAQVGLMDFMPRKRSRHNIYLIGAFVCCIIAIIIVSSTSEQALSREISGGLLCIALIILCLITIYVRQRNNDLVLATEFQNMIYSSAMTAGSTFVLIAKRNGSVVHMSRGLADLFNYFPYTTPHALEGMFIEGRVPKFDQDKIINAMERDERKSLIIKLAASAGTTDMVLSIEPLTRPSGYYLLRARPFYESRGDAGKLDSVGAETFRALLEASPVAHFVCDEFGRFEYVNKTFAQLCGLNVDEMLEEHLQLKDVVSLASGKALSDEFEFNNLSEYASITTRDHQPVPVYLSLTVKKTQGHASALVGTVTKA